MKRILKLVTVLMAVALLAALPVTCLYAEGSQYKETVLTTPPLMVDWAITKGVFPHGDGSIDIYIVKPADESMTKFVPYHTYSPDGGKTWTEKKDLGWLDRYHLQNEDYSMNSLFMLPDGTLTAVMSKGGGNYRYFQGKGDAMTELTLPDGADGMTFGEILDVKENGDFLLLGSNYSDADNPKFAQRTVSAQGTVKSEAQLPDYTYWKGGGWSYSDEQKYDEEGDLTAWDIIARQGASGAEKRIPLPLCKDSGSSTVDWMAQPDGTLMAINAEGLYRCPVGGNAFERVLDAKSCTLGTSQWSGIFFYPSSEQLPDGSVYAHFSEEDYFEGGKGKFCIVRYMPA